MCNLVIDMRIKYYDIITDYQKTICLQLKCTTDISTVIKDNVQELGLTHAVPHPI